MLRKSRDCAENGSVSGQGPDDAKVKLQTYITGCYGSLTSFNLLFAEEDDQFKGQGE